MYCFKTISFFLINLTVQFCTIEIIYDFTVTFSLAVFSYKYNNNYYNIRLLPANTNKCIETKKYIKLAGETVCAAIHRG